MALPALPVAAAAVVAVARAPPPPPSAAVEKNLALASSTLRVLSSLSLFSRISKASIASFPSWARATSDSNSQVHSQ